MSAGSKGEEQPHRLDSGPVCCVCREFLHLLPLMNDKQQQMSRAGLGGWGLRALSAFAAHAQKAVPLPTTRWLCPNMEKHFRPLVLV